MRAQNKDKEFMNYPYPRATDIMGASMATPSHLMKDHRSPTKAKHIKSGTLNINPTEILSQIYGISEYVGKKGSSFDNNGWRQSNVISSEEYPMMSPHEMQSSQPYKANSFIYFDENQQLFGINGYSHHIPTAKASGSAYKQHNGVNYGKT